MNKSNNIFQVDKNNKDKKQVFIDATICSLADHGYKGTTVRQIAKYAGVAPGLLTHYYPGKEELIAESYKYLSRKFLSDFHQRIEKQEMDPLKVLQLFFRNFFEEDILEVRYLRVWLAFWTLTLAHPELIEIHKGLADQYTSAIEGMLLSALEATNTPHTATETRSLAIGISAMLDGLWLECCLNPGAFLQERYLNIAYEYVESTTGLRIKPEKD